MAELLSDHELFHDENGPTNSPNPSLFSGTNVQEDSCDRNYGSKRPFPLEPQGHHRQPFPNSPHANSPILPWPHRRSESNLKHHHRIINPHYHDRSNLRIQLRMYFWDTIRHATDLSIRESMMTVLALVVKRRMRHVANPVHIYIYLYLYIYR